MSTRNIAQPGEKMFLIEETGSRSTAGAIVEGADLCPPPESARVVGTVTFKDSRQYKSLKAWDKDRGEHRIQEGSQHDWRGPRLSQMRAGTVEASRRFAEPIPVGAKSSTGWARAQTLEVKFRTEATSVGDSPS